MGEPPLAGGKARLAVNTAGCQGQHFEMGGTLCWRVRMNGDKLPTCATVVEEAASGIVSVSLAPRVLWLPHSQQKAVRIKAEDARFANLHPNQPFVENVAITQPQD